MSKHVCYCMLLCLCKYMYACKDVNVDACTSVYVNLNDYMYVHAHLHVFSLLLSCSCRNVCILANIMIMRVAYYLHICQDNPSSFEEEHEATSHWDWLKPQVASLIETAKTNFTLNRAGAPRFEHVSQHLANAGRVSGYKLQNVCAQALCSFARHTVFDPSAS